MRHDSLSDALVLIKNADHVGKESAVVPASRLIGDVLKLLTEKGYLNNYEYKESALKYIKIQAYEEYAGK